MKAYDAVLELEEFFDKINKRYAYYGLVRGDATLFMDSDKVRRASIVQYCLGQLANGLYGARTGGHLRRMIDEV